MSRLPSPVVRSLVACEEIVRDADTQQVSLLRVVNTVRSNGAPAYPALRPHFAVFAVLTSGRGAGELWMEIRAAEGEGVIYASPRQRVAFPDDPLMLHGASYRIRNLVFPLPGLYWVQLRYDGAVIADLPVVLK